MFMTGSSAIDAERAFTRAARGRRRAALARRLRRAPADGARLCVYGEPRVSRPRTNGGRGVREIPIDAISGTLEPSRAALFDGCFRPSARARGRGRWERVWLAEHRGAVLPPISVVAVDDGYAVRDGHHRVSVARSLGREDIDAYVTEVETRVGPGRDVLISDLPVKGHERLFRERVPLDEERLARIQPSDPWDYGILAEGVEAWGFRAMQGRRHFMDRAEVAQLWFDEDYEPVSAMLDAADLVERGETETDAYMRVVTARYMLLRTHEWSDEVLERLRSAQKDKKRTRMPPKRRHGKRPGY